MHVYKVVTFCQSCLQKARLDESARHPEREKQREHVRVRGSERERDRERERGRKRG